MSSQPNQKVAGARSTSASGLAIIKHFEGCRLEAYQCPAGVWTIGYGSTRGVVPGLRVTEAGADERLRFDVDQVDHQLSFAVHVPLSQNQWDALASFAFNLGIGTLRSSTLLS